MRNQGFDWRVLPLAVIIMIFTAVFMMAYHQTTGQWPVGMTDGL